MTEGSEVKDKRKKKAEKAKKKTPLGSGPELQAKTSQVESTVG